MPGPSPSRAPLRVGLLGLGTVGREVARGLLARRSQLAAAAGGRELRLVAIGVRNPGVDRGLPIPTKVRRTDDLPELVGASDLDVIVELLGGLDPAGELVVAALDAGKAVVTANKALLSQHGPAIEALARANAAPLRFEAAVAGGIPILSPMGGDLAANAWTSVAGIVNGSTNYVLSEMARGGVRFEVALADASARGYLEADPRADTEGRDAAEKLAILVRLAFGAWPDVRAIRCAVPLRGAAAGGPGVDGEPGITGLTDAAFEGARERGLTIKLIASARRLPRGRVAASVLPTAVPSELPLARTGGARNRVELRGEPIGEIAFEGSGAGGAATSSAVLGDLIALARGQGSTWGGLASAGPQDADDLDDGLGAVRDWLTCGDRRYPILTGA